MTLPREVSESPALIGRWNVEVLLTVQHERRDGVRRDREELAQQDVEDRDDCEHRRRDLAGQVRGDRVVRRGRVRRDPLGGDLELLRVAPAPTPAGLNLVVAHRFAGRYAVTTAAPPRPMLCCSATFAPSTCRASASPRSCQVSSAHCARPVAPSGWPLEIRPPDGLTTQRPPYVVSPLSTSLPPSPSAHSPSAS